MLSNPEEMSRQIKESYSEYRKEIFEKYPSEVDALKRELGATLGTKLERKEYSRTRLKLGKASGVQPGFYFFRALSMSIIAGLSSLLTIGLFAEVASSDQRVPVEIILVPAGLSATAYQFRRHRIKAEDLPSFSKERMWIEVCSSNLQNQQNADLQPEFYLNVWNDAVVVEIPADQMETLGKYYSLIEESTLD